MGKLEDAQERQLANIESRHGTTVAALVERVAASGLDKHGQIVKMLKEELGMGHGDANLIAHVARAAPSPTDPAEGWYNRGQGSASPDPRPAGGDRGDVWRGHRAQPQEGLPEPAARQAVRHHRAGGSGHGRDWGEPQGRAR